MYSNRFYSRLVFVSVVAIRREKRRIMSLSHFLKTMPLLLLLIMSTLRTAYTLQNQCQGNFDPDLIDDNEEVYGRFEFACVGCCDYNETIHKAFMEEAIEEFINEELNCLGSGEDGDVLYVSLDTWIEGVCCP